MWLLLTHCSCRELFCVLSHSMTHTHTHTHTRTLSVGLLWTSDRPCAETSTWQHTTLTTDIHVPGGIRSRNSSKRAAADRRLRLRGHRHRQLQSRTKMSVQLSCTVRAEAIRLLQEHTEDVTVSVALEQCWPRRSVGLIVGVHNWKLFTVPINILQNFLQWHLKVTY